MPKRPVFIPKQDRTEKPDPASQPDKTIKQDWGGTQPPVRSPSNRRIASPVTVDPAERRNDAGPRADAPPPRT
jgi:hypothetical protein